jgi:receptor protein-tyrosine kinase
MLVMAHHADWFAMEQYRYLRTHVKQASREFQHPIILVTSAHPGEGKSVTAANLAVALALESENEILLIDGELRKANIHTLFGLDQSPGLANVLSGASSLDDVIHQGPANRLKIIPAGDAHLHPADLLGSRQCKGLFDHLRTRFGYIVIDSPPLLAVTDGRILSHWVDGVVLVVRSGSTRQDVYHDAATHLAGQRVLGVVVNSLPSTYFTQRYGNTARYGYYGRPDVKSLPG